MQSSMLPDDSSGVLALSLLSGASPTSAAKKHEREQVLLLRGREQRQGVT